MSGPELYSDKSSSNDANSAFGDLLQAWMRSHGVDQPVGAIIVALEVDGFSLLQLGPSSLSAERVIDYLDWVVRQSRAAQLRRGGR